MAERIAETRQSGNGAFDWAAAYERLNRALKKIQEEETPTAEQTAQILRQRAAIYANRPAEKIEQYIDVVAFACGEERYAIPLAESAAVAALANLTPLPGLPSLYLGLLNCRGAIYPVIDPRPLLSGPQPENAALTHAVLVSNDSGSIGLAASEIFGVLRFRSDAVAHTGKAGDRHQSIVGIGPNETIIIDPSRLLLDIRLSVDEQPEITISSTGEKP